MAVGGWVDGHKFTSASQMRRAEHLQLQWHRTAPLREASLAAFAYKRCAPVHRPRSTPSARSRAPRGGSRVGALQQPVCWLVRVLHAAPSSQSVSQSSNR
jgi:hypothetical protein